MTPHRGAIKLLERLLLLLRSSIRVGNVKQSPIAMCANLRVADGDGDRYKPR